MYKRDVPKYVVSDLQQEVRQTEERVMKGSFASPMEREQVVRRLAFLEKKLADFAEGSTREAHLERAERYAAHANGKAPRSGGMATQMRPVAPRGDRSERPGPSPAASAEAEDDFGKLAEGLIRKSGVQWDEIAGLQDTKSSIVSSMRLFFIEKPKGIRIAIPDKILLYGPPGTGKTMLASAAATMNNMTFFEVAVSRDLLSKWVGDSPKILDAIYRKAEEKAPSIVFMDEVTVLVAQNEQQHEVSKQLHDTFLTLLDGFASKTATPKVLTIATTNLPWKLSEAMKSRFQKQIYVPLPDEPARREVLSIETKGHQLRFSLDALAKRTLLYSGRDLKNLCSEAIHLMLMEANPGLTSPKGAPVAVLKTLPLTEAHFERAMRSNPARTQPEDVHRFEEYQSKGG